MEIDLCSGNVLVAKHLLDGAEIGPSFEKMGCEGVAEGMRRHFLADSGGFGKLLDDVENHDARQPVAAAVQKKDIFFSALDGEQSPVPEDNPLFP